MGDRHEKFVSIQPPAYRSEDAEIALLASAPSHDIGALASDITAGDRPRTAWRQYGVFVSAVTLFTIALTWAVPQLVRNLAIGCVYPDCLDPGADIARSLKDVKGDPCQDFYGYVCAGWQRANPDAKNHFESLQKRVSLATVVSLVLEEAEGSRPSQRVARLFQRCAQLAFNEQDRRDELRRFLKRFDLAWPAFQARSKRKVLELIVALSLDWGLPVLFQLTLEAHLRRPGFLALYFDSSPHLVEWVAVRSSLQEQGALLAYFDRVSVLLSGSPADRDIIQMTLAVDNRVLSAVASSTADLRPDLEAQYIVLSHLDGLTGPELSTNEWLETLNMHLPEALGPSDEMCVKNRPLLQLMGHLMGQASHDAAPLLAYITWHTVRILAPMTSHLVVRQQFGGSRVAATIYMMGRCYVDADTALPFAFANVFARRWLQAESVDDVAAMEERIRNEANASMAALSWMDNGTKEVALKKLATLRTVVGRPAQLASDQALELLYPYLAALGSDGSYFELISSLRSMQLRYAKRFLRANGSAGSDVGMPLTAVNAFYLPVYHVMVIPAAILHPPFYVAGYPQSYNLGSLGHVLGHEMTHAFDPDMGLYNRDGSRRDWWTSTSRASFQSRLDCLRQMYNSLPWAEGLQYGDYATTENFADSGGLFKAYRAFRTLKGGNRRSPPASLAGFTDQQVFFLSSCFKWCSTEEKQGPGWYSPPMMRCNVPLMNMPEFAEAFDCGAGKIMNPAVRCNFM